jgi:hypothetical protein
MPLIAIVHITTDHTADVIDQVHTLEQIYGSRVVGIFDYPARSELKCNGSCVRKGSGAWGRDPRGFMRCSVCGSRNRKVRQWFIRHIFDLLGANLYPEAPAAFRTPEGYGPVRGQ